MVLNIRQLRLKRTYTADLLGNIENELQKGLNLLSEEQRCLLRLK